ncbi:hypothetical protein [Georgenia sp. AZ-5]|uniref:hypothetical protein n=1 Tax=Georgenia sp. AZ-5 TaxID=3367526 RepID=UPI003754A56A
MTDRHPAPDRLLDLALADVPGPEGDALARHLATCESCRREYAELAAGVDNVLAAAPPAEPPPGFDKAVLSAMGMVTADRARPPSGRAGRRRPGARPPARPGARRPRRLLAAVALGAALAGGAVGLGAGGLLWREPAADLVAGAPVRTDDGERVGEVAPSYYRGERVLVLDVAGRPGAWYECRLVLGDGTRQTAGEWTLDEAGTGSWVMPAPEGGAVGLELVTRTGAVWATAEL